MRLNDALVCLQDCHVQIYVGAMHVRMFQRKRKKELYGMMTLMKVIVMSNIHSTHHVTTYNLFYLKDFLFCFCDTFVCVLIFDILGGLINMMFSHCCT